MNTEQETMTTVYVGNLPVDAQPDALRNIFSRYGRVGSVKMVKSGVARRARSYGLVEMAKTEDADTAVHNLNGQYFRGLFMRVEQLPEKIEH
jgi:RNA recognition motif-containing protein